MVSGEREGERGGESKKDKKKKRKEKERGLAGVPLRQARAWLQWLCCPCMLLVSSLLLFMEDRACLRQHSINLHLLFYNLFIHCNLTKQIIFLLLIACTLCNYYPNYLIMSWIWTHHSYSNFIEIAFKWIIIIFFFFFAIHVELFYPVMIDHNIIKYYYNLKNKYIICPRMRCGQGRVKSKGPRKKGDKDPCLKLKAT